jgi:hypothetical protein
MYYRAGFANAQSKKANLLDYHSIFAIFDYNIINIILFVCGAWSLNGA